MNVTVITYPDADCLTDQLHAMNEVGNDPVLGGIDDEGRPFVAELSGPYAENVAVVFGSPWQPERSGGTAHCDECQALDNSTLDALVWPVAVVYRVPDHRSPEWDRAMRRD